MSIRDELQSICDEHDGMLNPPDVIEYARNPETELHSRFTWDDSEAAQQWRLEQARRVIRVHVEVVSEDTQPTQAFVSLYSDRYNGRGYRPIVDVLSAEDWRGELLAQAMKEARTWRKKYHALKELAPIFEVIDHVTEMPLASVVQEIAD